MARNGTVARGTLVPAEVVRNELSRLLLTPLASWPGLSNKTVVPVMLVVMVYYRY